MLKWFESRIAPFFSSPAKKAPPNLFAFCLHFTKGYRWPLFLMSALTTTLAIIEVYLFGLMGDLVDWFSQTTAEAFFTAYKTELLIAGMAIVIVFPILTFVHASITHQTLLGNFPMTIRWLTHRYLLQQSIEFFQNDFAGRLATKVMQTSLAVRETVMKLLDVIMYIAVYFTSMLILVGQAHIYFTLCILLWFSIYCVLQYYFIPRLKSVSTAQADARADMTGRIVDSYSNISTVKLFSHTQQEASYAKQSMKAFLQTVYRQMRLVTKLSVSVQILNYLLLLLISYVAITLWQEDLVSPGETAIAISLALRLNGMSQWIMWELSSLFENIGTVSDGMKTLSTSISVNDSPNAKNLLVERGVIEYRSIDFHYGKRSGVIENLDLKINAGEKVGLVGRSGAGKSTLVNLLLRFYDLEAGTIFIDDQDIAKVKQESLRSQIAMVTQDTSLLHRTVRENILYGNPEASESDLLAAIDQAEVKDFLSNLVDLQGNQGLDAQVGERGVKLSGGQRQRIAIARVLLKNAPILVLDEATSALDSEVEAAIQSSLYKLMEGKTVIAIAHRLSTIAAMDRLIVMDDGKIIEQGTHKELLDLNGIYAKLWRHQTGGFLGEV